VNTQTFEVDDRISLLVTVHKTVRAGMRGTVTGRTEGGLTVVQVHNGEAVEPVLCFFTNELRMEQSREGDQ
jgi:hypothetical protein